MTATSEKGGGGPPEKAPVLGKLVCKRMSIPPTLIGGFAHITSAVNSRTRSSFERPAQLLNCIVYCDRNGVSRRTSVPFPNGSLKLDSTSISSLPTFWYVIDFCKWSVGKLNMV